MNVTKQTHFHGVFGLLMSWNSSTVYSHIDIILQLQYVRKF